MNNYYSLRIDMSPCSEDATDLLAGYLSDEGYESFVADDKGLTAYIKEEDYRRDVVDEIMKDFPFEPQYTITAELIEGQDWNHEWEKNYFKPIVISGQCVIRSSFHTDAPTAPIEIIIDPKMAFGTGHHATTTMMATHLLNNPPAAKTIIDMGTGTGILALLAKKLGAESATGIEIDPAAYENAVENARLNDCDIRLLLGDASRLSETPPADILLANINRNIILGDIAAYAASLKEYGTMYLSGFYPQDAPMIEEAAEKLGLKSRGLTTLGEWASLTLVKE
ncbi:MAG: 50S ribosomal protein L11 methyltransferase [Clostridium sp.]|nr:50S ribosomal protein L11 methyltransferase [Prevotella sp.]MCM1429709.1 50S ribosomal protein L11 methyltransferase [Clostridium sp.]MCM1474635.1 50S ribosomal protein L11 methyltransferase [Muribaculaceae bacterium]